MAKVKYEKYLRKLGKRIRKIRIEKGISTYQLSYDSDVSRSQIASIEKGAINTSICTLKALCDAMDMELKELVDF